MTMRHVLPVLLGAALMAVAPTLVAAQEAANPASPTRPVSTRFKCQDGGELTALFAITDARLVAIVDSGDGSHALPVQPWTGGLVVLTWSDGQHTLTWSPGVQIMWMDGATHRMCGRGEHKH